MAATLGSGHGASQRDIAVVDIGPRLAALPGPRSLGDKSHVGGGHDAH
jgi:hypothetical protein